MKTLLNKLGKATLWGLTVFITFCLCLFTFGIWWDSWMEYYDYSISDGWCNIAVVPVLGNIYIDEPSHDGSQYYAVANADEVLDLIARAEADPFIQGLLVRIDSTGGTPVAAEMIAKSLKRSALPSAAVIREYGTSGGYLVATGADTIFASPFSDVGSIAVTMSYLDNVEKNNREGLRYNVLSSGQFKDITSPDKKLTDSERRLLERDLQAVHGEFVRQVAENREMEISKIDVLADGSSMTGALALENGLVDALGDQETARQWFAETMSVDLWEVEFCEVV